MKLSGVLFCAGLLLSAAALAQGQQESRPHNGGDTDVVVNLPAEAWTQGNNSQSAPPCARCCTYGNQNYTEGAVIKAVGVLLQCTRDKTSLGTNNLLWQVLKQ